MNDVINLVRVPPSATKAQIAECLKKIKAAGKNSIQVVRAPFFEKEMNIALGDVPRNAESIRKALYNEDFFVGAAANALLESKDYMSAVEGAMIRVGVVSGTELGFTKDFVFAELVHQANKFGLRPLISEAGPKLRLAYVRQMPTRVHVVTKPLRLGGHRYLFCLDNVEGGGRYLSAIKVDQNTQFGPDSLWAVHIAP